MFYIKSSKLLEMTFLGSSLTETTLIYNLGIIYSMMSKLFDLWKHFVLTIWKDGYTLMWILVYLKKKKKEHCTSLEEGMFKEKLKVYDLFKQMLDYTGNLERIYNV